VKIVNRKPGELNAAEYNPRELTEKQHADLTASIEEFGLVDPIIVNKHAKRMDVIIGGHQRVRIATELGHKTVPTVEVKLDEKRERELNIRLNKNVGQWDWDVMVQHFEVQQIEAWGFEKEEIDLSLFTRDVNMPDTLPTVNLEGAVDGMVEWVVIRFETQEEYRALCKLLDMREGSRTVNYSLVGGYFDTVPDSDTE